MLTRVFRQKEQCIIYPLHGQRVLTRNPSICGVTQRDAVRQTERTKQIAFDGAVKASQLHRLSGTNRTVRLDSILGNVLR